MQPCEPKWRLSVASDASMISSQVNYTELPAGAAAMILQEQPVHLYLPGMVDRMWLNEGQPWHRICRAPVGEEQDWRLMR